MKLHYKSLKAAVAKYSPLVEQGKNEDDVKAELAKDEKAFTTEQVDEIYAAITADPVKDTDSEENEPVVEGYDENAQYVVLKRFNDINDFSLIRKPKEDVSDFEPKRLMHLVELGLVVKK